MVEKSTRGGICHVIHQYAKANNKYMKHKKKEPSYLNYWDVNNMDGQCHKSYLQVVIQLSKDFMESYNEDSDEG